MNIGILGSGVVGQQLALGLLKLGHSVKVGTRDAGKLAEWLQGAGSNASVGSFAEAAAYGEAVILATSWAGTFDALQLAGTGNFDGKIVVDVTNPLDFSQGAPPRMASTPAKSGSQQIADVLPGAKVVKAFNTISAYIMISAPREEGVPQHFVAGDEDGKKLVTEWSLSWGWSEVIDLGGLEQSFLLEALAQLWIIYGFKNNNWTHAFKLLKK